ncbi:hypothetical protein EW146_g7653 [Bondarzewia mesenterica]|uniref:3-oxoacyl-[acyl-carrier-protein] reductase n=1 Tax=Bondarzewia mesenterica TaxID=1095465 RepID=A0A4S4LM16_9AGAM|nr:hypothetical protein EW146_g7653 [Bondarzewia mesenterica]
MTHSSHTRVALVTGAAQGIGRAIALRLATDGINVAVNDITKFVDTLQGLVTEIESKGVKALAVPADVTSEEAIKEMVATTVQHLGRLDVMVANAGIGGEDSLLTMSTDAWRKVMSVNVEGVLFCYKHAALQMIKQGNGGRIIGACSILGKKGHEICPVQIDCSKLAAAMELAEHGITVNAYAPGIVETRLSEFSPGAGTAPLKSMLKIPDAPSVPKEEVANLVSYLASPQSQSITGQCINIDGGVQFD